MEKLFLIFWLHLVVLGVYTTVFKFESHWIKFQGDISTRSWKH